MQSGTADGARELLQGLVECGGFLYEARIALTWYPRRENYKERVLSAQGIAR